MCVCVYEQEVDVCVCVCVCTNLANDRDLPQVASTAALNECHSGR